MHGADRNPVLGGALPGEGSALDGSPLKTLGIAGGLLTVLATAFGRRRGAI